MARTATALPGWTRALSTQHVFRPATMARLAFCSVVVAVGLVVSDRVAAADPDPSAWRILPIDLGPSDPVDGGWTIGGGPNPVIALPVDPLRGRWLRFSATVDSASRGLGLRINASSALQRTGSIPVTCDGRPLMSHCTTSFWMPPDSEHANAVAWVDREAGRIFDPRVEVAQFPEARQTIGHRADAFVAQVRADYYRTGEVDWTDVQRDIAAMPAPPDDLDPLPGIAQVLRSRLPGNKHVVIQPTSLTNAPTSTVAMPACDTAGDRLGVLTLPGLTPVTGDAPIAYAKALHDCLMHGADRRAWIVDLRGNSGGNMHPMIGGLAPLLPVGGLYTFVNGHRIATAQVGIDGSGVTINHKVAFRARDAGSRVRPPLVVVFGTACGSSCEQTANALAVRPHTLFIGEPTAGYLTANSPLIINDAYVMSLTTGYTQDPCGRVIEDKLSPDVAVEHVATRSIDELLALPLVHDWLEQQARSSVDDRRRETLRCDRAQRRALRRHGAASRVAAIQSQWNPLAIRPAMPTPSDTIIPPRMTKWRSTLAASPSIFASRRCSTPSIRCPMASNFASNRRTTSSIFASSR